MVGELCTGALNAATLFGPVPTFDEDAHLYGNPFNAGLHNFFADTFNPRPDSDTEDKPDSKLEANVEEV